MSNPHPCCMSYAKLYIDHVPRSAACHRSPMIINVSFPLEVLLGCSDQNKSLSSPGPQDSTTRLASRLSLGDGDHHCFILFLIITDHKLCTLRVFSGAGPRQLQYLRLRYNLPSSERRSCSPVHWPFTVAMSHYQE